MDQQFSSLESFSSATDIGLTVLDTTGNISFTSSIYRDISDAVHRLITALSCFDAERDSLIYGIQQSRRFGGRYNFLAPSGLFYCASPLTGKLSKTHFGVIAGPFLMTDHDDFFNVNVLPKYNKTENVGLLKDSIRVIHIKTPVQARAICEMLALVSEHCNDSLGPFNVPYNEALAASLKHMDVLSKAILFIKQNYMNKIKLQDIADYIFLSPTYFAKIFREEMGVTPGSYITAIRIDECKRLLRNSTINIVDIPELVGFESQSYFTRVFKKAEGKTPGEYRRSK